MSFVMSCPFCSATVTVPETAKTATCPACAQTFRAVRPVEAEAVAARQGTHRAGASSRSYDSDDAPDDDGASMGEGLLPAWVSLWGFLASILAAAALLAAALAGVRWLTLAFSMLGIVSVGVGVALTAKNRKGRDLVWLTAGGVLSVGVLCLTLTAPGILNRYWAMDLPVPVADPHKLVAVPRDEPRSPGRPLTPEEWVDSVKEMIRQDDAQVRINAVALGPVPEKPGQSFLLINVRFACANSESFLPFEGFTKTKHQPILRDAAGKSYAFVEQRQRKPAAGAVVYIAAEPQKVTLGPGRFFDMQLVFEAPVGDFTALQLELPASAYGRKGACKFNIPELFVAPIPEVQQK